MKDKLNRKSKDVEELVIQVRRLFHRFKAVGEQIHQHSTISIGHRAILESLYREGPQTVPEMARAKPVSRQHIQKLVNGLIEGSYVHLLPNPSHKKSSLVELTVKGKKLFERLRERESDVTGGLALPVSLDEIRSASSTLKTLGDYFESPKWLVAVKELSES